MVYDLQCLSRDDVIITIFLVFITTLDRILGTISSLFLFLPRFLLKRKEYEAFHLEIVRLKVEIGLLPTNLQARQS